MGVNIYNQKSHWRNHRIPSGKHKQNVFTAKNLANLTILIFLILFLNIFQSQIRNYFYIVSSPISQSLARTSRGSYNFLESFLQSRYLKRENNNLKEENQKLISQLAVLRENLTEKEAAQELIKNTKGYNYETIPAKIAGLYGFDGFILINKGSDNGIQENMPLISSQKVLYGKIFKVYKNFSQVMLISNKNSVVNVKVQSNDLTKKPVYGVVKGRGDSSLNLDLVNYDAEIEENNVVITSGLEGTFPLNLLVGKIKSVNKDDLKAFQTAQVLPFFSIENMDVFVITNYLQAK